MYPAIDQVVPFNDYTVYVYFEDEKIVCYDVKPLLGKPVFLKLQNYQFFHDRCTIINDTLAWDVTGNRDPSQCINIDPDTLYELDVVAERIA